MALRSGSNSIAYWGRFATAAALPNVAASATQTAFLETGDTAFVTGTSVLYVCTTSTLNAAAWVALPMNFANTATAGPAAAAGSAITALRSDVTIPIAFGGDTQGDLTVRGAAAYQRLAAAATGRVLTSAGVGQLPTWALPGPAVAPPNSFAADFAVTSVTAPQVKVTTAGGVVNISGADSLTYDIKFDLLKTNTGTNKITAKCPVGWTINGGTVSTDSDLTGSNAAAKGFYQYHTDIANLAIFVHPFQHNSSDWGWG
jgi:hypothetical protein